MQSFYQSNVNYFPELGIIPESIWNNENFFNSELLDWHKDFLTLPIDKIKSLILKHQLMWTNFQADQNTIIIMIALKFTDLTTEEIMQFKTLLDMSNEALLLNAYRINHQALIQFIENKLSQSQLLTILRQGAFSPYDFFEAASTFGHTHLMDHLFELLPKEHLEMIQANQYAGIINAKGEQAFKILNKYPEILSVLSETQIVRIYSNAILYQQWEVIHLLFQKRPELIDQFITFKDYCILRDNSASTLELVFNHRPDVLELIPSQKQYELLVSAIHCQSPEILEYIYKKMPTVFSSLISENSKYLFSTFDLKIPNFLVLFKLLPKAQQFKIIQQKNYQIFERVCNDNHVEFFKYILSSFPQEIPKFMIKTKYSLFVEAASKNQIEICKLLLAHPKLNIADMLSSSYFKGGIYFVRFNIEDPIIFRLIAQYPEQMKQIFDKHHLDIFDNSKNILSKLKLYKKHYPESFLRVVSNHNFRLFMFAAESETPDAMRLILEATPELNEKMLTAYDFKALKTVKAKNNHASLEFLKQFEIIHSYLQINAKEYGLPENDYIRLEIASLKEAQEAFNRTHPGQIYDVSPRQNLMLYYMLKALISNDHEHALVTLNLLLSLPSFRERVHLNSENIPNNEIYQLASNKHNLAIIERLSREPNVEELNLKNCADTLLTMQHTFFQSLELPTENVATSKRNIQSRDYPPLTEQLLKEHLKNYSNKKARF